MSQREIDSENHDFKIFLTRLKGQDERAWSDLNFVLTRVVLKWLSKKKIYSEHANEIFCATMSVFIEKFDALQFDNFNGLKSYVFSIADNKLKEFYRADSKNKRHDSLDTIPESSYISLISEIDKEDTQLILQRVYKLLDMLSEMERMILKLLFKEEKSVEEAANILKISRGNVRVIKCRAIEKLKKLYAKYYK